MDNTDMTSVQLVTPRRSRFLSFEETLSTRRRCKISWAETGLEALEATSQKPSGWVVVDESLPDMSGLEFVRRLMGVNAWIQTAVVSRLSDGDFHEASEGLGVALRLSAPPGQKDAEKLLDLMESTPLDFGAP
ncbi:MAG: response regulator [Desulfobacterales bacterium]|jgi:CheY-like chemotaxis protein